VTWRSPISQQWRADSSVCWLWQAKQRVIMSDRVPSWVVHGRVIQINVSVVLCCQHRWGKDRTMPKLSIAKKLFEDVWSVDDTLVPKITVGTHKVPKSSPHIIRPSFSAMDALTASKTQTKRPWICLCLFSRSTSQGDIVSTLVPYMLKWPRLWWNFSTPMRWKQAREFVWKDWLQVVTVTTHFGCVGQCHKESESTGHLGSCCLPIVLSR